jgi:putative hydrolase of the HAD superfamily
MEVGAILFDLDGTLRHNDPPGVATFHGLAAELGVAASPEARLEAERWVYAYWANSAQFQEDERASGGQHDDAFWRRHAERHLRVLGAPEPRLAKLAREIHRRMMQEYQPEDRVPEDVLPTLARLRRAGYRLGLVSNRDEPLGSVVSSLDLEGAFDFTLAAGEVGWWKPNPRLLWHAVALAGVVSERAVYVGDNYYADVVCAQAAGLKPVLLDPAGLFPEADCPVIAAIGHLPSVLEPSA